MREVFSKLLQISKPRKPKMRVRATATKFMPNKKLLQTSDTIRAIKYVNLIHTTLRQQRLQPIGQGSVLRATTINKLINIGAKT